MFKNPWAVSCNRIFSLFANDERKNLIKAWNKQFDIMFAANPG